MKLPHGHLAVVEPNKITGYLLNHAHRYGASKARFFAEFGFTAEKWEDLAHALLEHGGMNEVVRVKQTSFGPRYEVDGDLTTPDGRHPRVRSVWQVDEGHIAPRLITAYPMEQS